MFFGSDQWSMWSFGQGTDIHRFCLGALHYRTTQKISSLYFFASDAKYLTFSFCFQVCKGKCLVSTRDIEEGELILIDSPIIQSPYTKSRKERYLWHCLILSRWYQWVSHASSLRMPREKKCPADTINEFELYDSPWLLEDVSKLLARGNAIQPITGLVLVTFESFSLSLVQWEARDLLSFNFPLTRS